MNPFKYLTLRTKLIGSFLFLAVIAGILSYVGTQLSFAEITDDTIPSRRGIGQISTLAKTVQAEALEFVSTDDKESIEQFRASITGLDSLTDNLKDNLSDDPNEQEPFENLAALTKQVRDVGEEIIRTHQQTLEHFEALEKVEHEFDPVLDEAREIVQTRLAERLTRGTLDETTINLISIQQNLDAFTIEAMIIQHGALEFITSGEDEIITEFDDAGEALATRQAVLVDLIGPDDPDLSNLVATLGDIQKRFTATGAGILETHARTREALDVLKGVEVQLDEAIVVTQQLADQDVNDVVTRTNRNIALFAGTIVIVSLILGMLLTQTIVRPIYRLVQVARQLGSGDFTIRADVASRDEIGGLAQDFNTMAHQLQTSFVKVEQYADRLEIIANLSEHLNAILHLKALLAEVVNQVKDRFQYYHVHIYLLDDDDENLVVAEGTGEAGAKMKANHYSIPLHTPTSLVARSARDREVVRANNVREAVDWLPNPLLPDTFSEMAVPIILDEQVVGVLDVQQNEIAGLDEGDASLLRFLANQVAVAIRNAGSFEQVETALAKAREAQEQYVIQAWDKDTVAHRTTGRAQFSSDGVFDLAETEIVEARRQALVQFKPAVVTINGHGPETGKDQDRLDAPEPQNDHTTPLPNAQPADQTGHQALVTPIILHQHPIGNLQLHYDDPERIWTDSELAFIKTVMEQVAQTAENLRLFTETKERISRERLLGKINDKMRRAPNIENLMEIAVEELGRVLRPARTFVRLGSEGQLGRSTNGQQNGQEAHHPAERNGVELADPLPPERVDEPSPVNESTPDDESQRS